MLVDIRPALFKENSYSSKHLKGQTESAMLIVNIKIKTSIESIACEIKQSSSTPKEQILFIFSCLFAVKLTSNSQ